MWPFSRKPTKATLQGYKRITILGQRFVIRRLSPLIDFPPDRMPQIFTDTTRGIKPNLAIPSIEKRVREDMYSVLLAGVVDPPLVFVGKDGLTPEDIFRDNDVGTRLYISILEHSLFKLKLWQIPFFFAAKLLIRFTIWLKNTTYVPLILFLRGRI